MIRFSHTVFALPFALLSAVMAWRMTALDGEFSWIDFLRQLVGVLLCMIFARSAAMAFNRLADRRIDALNPRTAGRHLPAGILSVRRVAMFTVASSIGFVASTLLFLPNILPVALSLPVLAFLLAYSFTKRVTSLAHFWLGAALMLAPVSAWIAIRGQTLPRSPLDILPAAWLGLAVMLWVSGFDIIYACQDQEFDVRQRLRSIPARFGVRGALRLAALCHVGMIGVLASLPLVCPELRLGWLYAAALVAATGLLTYEHAIVRPNDLARVNLAFFHVNAIIGIGLFVVVSLDLFV
jgi:4-hydroxybenzoate polyprenyltransferase